MIRRAITKLWHTRKPTFIMSPAFLKPNSPPMVHLHRQIWLSSCRHPVGFFINFFAILRWIGYYTWKLSFKACKTRTDQQLQEYGLTRLALFRALVKLGLLNFISPHYYFKYQFYKPEQAPKKLDYIYTQELPYVHDHSNRHFKQSQQARTLISDKYRFSCALQEMGVPTVASTIHDTSLWQGNPCWLLQKKTLFCKPNNASQSKDAFLIAYSAETNVYQIVPVQGNIVVLPQEIEAYLKKIIARHRLLLLQPFLTDHPEIKKLASQPATTTVRIITIKSADTPQLSPQLLYLQLEIPNQKQATSGQQYYTLLPLDRRTLDVDATFKNKPWCLEKQDITISEALKMLLRQSIDYCILAHQTLLDLRTVSFDVIIGEMGPVILEANYNWSVELLYHVNDIHVSEIFV